MTNVTLSLFPVNLLNSKRVPLNYQKLNNRATPSSYNLKIKQENNLILLLYFPVLFFCLFFFLGFLRIAVSHGKKHFLRIQSDVI